MLRSMRRSPDRSRHTNGRTLEPECEPPSRSLNSQPCRSLASSRSTETLACHHGTVKAGHIATYLAAFRHHDVTGLVLSDPVYTLTVTLLSDGPPSATDR